MSSSGDAHRVPFQSPARPPESHQRDPLLNLSDVRSRMDSLQSFLSDSVSRNRLIGREQMEMVSTEISAAIHQIIVNGAALLASTAQINHPPPSDLKFLPTGVPRAETNSSVSAVKGSPVVKDATTSGEVPGVGASLSAPRLFTEHQLDRPLADGPTATDLEVIGKLGDVERKSCLSLMNRSPMIDTATDVEVPGILGDFGMKAATDLSNSIGVDFSHMMHVREQERKRERGEHEIGSVSKKQFRGAEAQNETKSVELELRGEAKGPLCDLGTDMKGVVGMKAEEEEMKDEVIIPGEEDWDIIELDAVELLAEHIHFCDICGKGFKRDANLRMHMRAHGNQFKTPEALAKPEKSSCELDNRRNKATRFSCPFTGCNRNKLHKKFRPLKSVICVKNHFKRSHCPKMYLCNRCNKKSFSVVADLKSHLKHCGETKWKCTCGTTFSRKDKLFGHMALFEGHMPAVVEEEGKGAAVMAPVVVEEDEDDDDQTREVETGENGFFEGLIDGFNSIDGYCLQDALGSPYGLGPTMNDFFNF